MGVGEERRTSDYDGIIDRVTSYAGSIESWLESYADATGTGTYLAADDPTYPDLDDAVNQVREYATVEFEQQEQLLCVETDNATYAQYPGIPSLGYIESSVSETVVEEADAIVLASGVPYDDLEFEQLMDERYRSILEENLSQERPSPVYVTDMPTDFLQSKLIEQVNEKLPFRLGKRNAKQLMNNLSSRKRMKHLYKRANPAMWLLILPRSSGLLGVLPRTTGHGGSLASLTQLSKAHTSTGLQSAVAAEKIEDLIAPQREDELREKPHILIEYSMEDLDISTYLQKPHARKSVINTNTRVSNYVNFHTADFKYMDKVCEFRFDDSDAATCTYLDEDLDRAVSYEKTIHHIDNSVLEDDDSVLPHYRRPLNVAFSFSLTKEYVDDHVALMQQLEHSNPTESSANDADSTVPEPVTDAVDEQPLPAED